ncbi:hypothetical protein [Clostridium polynesiense]|uniref:hypothetical protein n=1 Tax=Clostridium polynesiense TaxID=1325933 RepID=UPI00059035A7|nr:hypothetical protein [Clostridium polynesiense]
MDKKDILKPKKENAIKHKSVPCPCCTNKRLMDMVYAEKTELEIKCNKCRNIIHISLINNEIFVSSI